MTNKTIEEQAAGASPPELLTLDEAAALLRKGRSTLYRYLAEGRITAYQVAGAGRPLFKRAELLALLVPMAPGKATRHSEARDEDEDETK
jgi:excisionase family DNA binding protein